MILRKIGSYIKINSQVLNIAMTIDGGICSAMIYSIFHNNKL